MPLSSNQIEDIFTVHQEHSKCILSNILNLNLNNQENEKIIVSSINKLLGSAKHRREGLEYLLLVIDNCNVVTINENAFTWINHCVIKYSEDVLREQKLMVLASIIENAHTESEFNKKFVSDYIAKVLDNCISTSHVNLYESKAALITLTACLKFYSSWFTSHKPKIENYLLLFLDHNSEDLVQAAAVAFHYLQQVGGAGSNGINHKTNFTQTFHKLCGTIQNLLHQFFEGQNEIFQSDHSDECFNFQSTSEASLFMLAKRLKNCLKFIEIMIRTQFPVAKEIKPKRLIELITLGMSFHKCVTKDTVESVESFQFSLLLSNIQMKLLNLLRLFIIWQNSNILMFSYPITKIIVDALERSQSCSCFKYECLYQESVYRTLTEWLKIAKSSLHVHFQTQVISSILKDITPVKSSVTLSISEATTKNQSAKAKRRFIENRIIASASVESDQSNSTSVVRSTEKNKCKFALKSLKFLLEYTKLSVSGRLLQNVYKSVFDTLASIQTSKAVIFPYTISECQLGLYEVLVAFYHQNTISVLPPLQTSINILIRGANSDDRFIANVCEEGIRILETLCQPICPTLYVGQANESDDLVEADEEEMPSLLIDEDDSSGHEKTLNDSKELDSILIEEPMEADSVVTTESNAEKSTIQVVSDILEGNTLVTHTVKTESEVTTLNSEGDLNEAEAINQNNENIELENRINLEENVTDSCNEQLIINEVEEIVTLESDSENHQTLENEDVSTKEENQRVSEESTAEETKCGSPEELVSGEQNKDTKSTRGESSSSLVEEPPLKKPRLEEHKADEDDVFEESGSFVEEGFNGEDSFVDEVKKY